MIPLVPFVIATLFTGVYGHGRIVSPPGRSTMWRVGYNTPANYNDNQLFCGGFYKQWTLNQGKCGVCGDPWDGPRENEAGGKYATGVVTANYTKGGLIQVQITITATHKGFHEFRLCPVNNRNVRATQDCLDRYLLKQPNGKTKFTEPDKTGTHMINLLLPNDLTCTQCVMQWKWNTGNSYGCDQDNNCCIGCGPQEQFYGCSDVAILGSLSTSDNGASTSYVSQILCLLICSFYMFCVGL